MIKSASTKNGLRESFKNGTSKMANRMCYGHSKAPDGKLVIDEDEAVIICWIFKHYLAGDSLGKITNGLVKKDIPSPAGKVRWNWEAIHKLLSNEKYTGKVLLQKTVSVCGRQFINDEVTDKVLYCNNRPAIISERMFEDVQAEKLSRSRSSSIMKHDMSF